MNPKPWSKPVKFEERLARYRTITNTEEAAHYLLNRWPSEGGRRHLKAQEVCLAVLESKMPPSRARAAFVAAAKEAGMFVMP